MTPKEKAADARLWRLYGISLSQFNDLFIEQGSVCAICKRPPQKFRLSVDHDHRFDRVKIHYHKGPVLFEWTAWAIDPHGRTHRTSGKSRFEAKRDLKRVLRLHSIRGLLCMSCNKGLQFYRDIPERFDAAAMYLRKFNRHDHIASHLRLPFMPTSITGVPLPR